MPGGTGHAPASGIPPAARPGSPASSTTGGPPQPRAPGDRRTRPCDQRHESLGLAYRHRAPGGRGTNLETVLARGAVVHASRDSDLSAPAELWPPAGQLVNSAIIGHVTLANVDGRSGAWRWVLTDPRQLAKPVTGVHGHPGLWLIDLPPRLSTGGDAPRLTWQSRPVAGPGLVAYVHAFWLSALIGIGMPVTCAQRKQHATSPLSDYRVWPAG